MLDINNNVSRSRPVRFSLQEKTSFPPFHFITDRSLSFSIILAADHHDSTGLTQQGVGSLAHLAIDIPSLSGIRRLARSPPRPATTTTTVLMVVLKRGTRENRRDDSRGINSILDCPLLRTGMRIVDGRTRGVRRRGLFLDTRHGTREFQLDTGGPECWSEQAQGGWGRREKGGRDKAR